MSTITEIKMKKELADNLSVFLAENYIMFLKLQIFHWNIKGEMFYMLHKMFEEEYNQFFKAIDDIAEHIIQLGFPTPSSLLDYINLSSIKEEDSIPQAKEMIKIILRDYRSLTINARNIIKIAENESLPETADLMTERIQEYNKQVWMLESLLQ